MNKPLTSIASDSAPPPSLRKSIITPSTFSDLSLLSRLRTSTEVLDDVLSPFLCPSKSV